MNNAMIFKSLSLGVILSLSSTVSILADGKPVVLPGKPSVKHYIVHVAGDIVGAIAAFSLLKTGLVIGTLSAVATASATECPEMGIPAFIVPTATGCAAAFYVYYKTPEWTDTYLLERGNGRTTKQNITTLLTRVFLPILQIGTCVGEYLVYEDDVNGNN